MQSFCKQESCHTNSFSLYFCKRNQKRLTLKRKLRMKKFLLSVVVVFSCMNMYAQGEVEMTLSRETPNCSSGRHKIPTQVPTVSYDATHVYVSAPCEIESSTIIIYNEDGEEIFSISIPLTTEQQTITLPSSVCDERYCLRLLYGSIDLVGYF